MTDVVLVDEKGKEIGVMEKIEAHRKGALHRAISVCVFHPDGRLMLQKRAEGKYHSGGLWANTCCSHPMPGESAHAAAVRRLKEEMGIECDLKEVGTFTYRAEFSNGLVEHEFDHVFVGVSPAKPTLNPEEAQDWKWAEVTDLIAHMNSHPEQYAQWLGSALELALRLRRLPLV